VDAHQDLLSDSYITSNLTFIESGYYAALFVAFFYVCANPFIYAIKFEPVKHVVMGLMPCKKSQQQAGGSSEMTGAGPSSSRSAQKRNWSFCIVGMCGIDFFFCSISVQVLTKKTRIRFGMSFVRFASKKTRFSSDIMVTYYRAMHVLLVDDMTDVTHVTYNNDNKYKSSATAEDGRPYESS